ncbi:MAG: hypothetical protein L0I76_19150 [Pseudonocardia sp.]|nr:hypothetical protein [Pseudonocardia sp.]
MAGRHSEKTVLGEDGRPVVDVTNLSPQEIRARMVDLEDGYEAKIEQARADLAESIDRLGEGVVRLRERMVAKARAALPAVAGASAVGVTAVVFVRVRATRARRQHLRRRLAGRPAGLPAATTGGVPVRL